MSSVNVVNEKASERMVRYSRLYGNIERTAEKIVSPTRVIRRKAQRRSNRWILNSAAARLGQAYKETSDILQRDNLESSASIINCVGGSNGRVKIAVLKSDLIEVELLAA